MRRRGEGHGGVDVCFQMKTEGSAPRKSLWDILYVSAPIAFQKIVARVSRCYCLHIHNS